MSIVTPPAVSLPSSRPAQDPPPAARLDDGAAPRSDAEPAGLHLPTMDDVRSLARAQHPVSVSVLMPTIPAPAMLPIDRARLEALVRDARRRLEEEPDAGAAADALAALDEAISAARSGPTDRGLAVLVSPDQAHVHHLRVSPTARVVVDPTFATRDLVRSATEDPALLMLVIDGRAARLFHYDQRSSRPILGADFPRIRQVPDRELSSNRTVERARREQTRSFLRRVDAGLAARVAATGLPVVLFASERTAAEFLAVSRAPRIAAVVHSGNLHMPLAQLEEVARAALAGHVRDRAAAALDTAHVRLAHGRAVAGLDAAWQALRLGDPDVLVVERTHAPAARVDGGSLELVGDPEEPGVIDDVVDELIEAVLARGAEVVTVPDGSLTAQGHVVLTMRGRVPDLVA